MVLLSLLKQTILEVTNPSSSVGVRFFGLEREQVLALAQEHFAVVVVGAADVGSAGSWGRSGCWAVFGFVVPQSLLEVR